MCAYKMISLGTETGCVSYLPWCCDQVPDKMMQGREVYFGSQFEGRSAIWRKGIGKQRETNQSCCGHCQEREPVEGQEA